MPESMAASDGRETLRLIGRAVEVRHAHAAKPEGRDRRALFAECASDHAALIVTGSRTLADAVTRAEPDNTAPARCSDAAPGRRLETSLACRSEARPPWDFSHGSLDCLYHCHPWSPLQCLAPSPWRSICPAPAARLYGMHLDKKQHAAITGAPVTIAARVGAPFRAFRGALSGRILELMPNRLIVQSWRSTQFGRRDLDSTLILSFWPLRKGGRIELTHVNVADSDFAGVSEGWSKYYWLPWRAYLARQ